MSEQLYHLVAAAEWPDDPVAYEPESLSVEGFIHLSTAAQVPATSLRFYRETPDLLLVAIDATRLSAEVVWEDLVGHGDFPHLYGRFDAEAVVAVRPYDAGNPVAT